MKYLIDTNVISELVRQEPNDRVIRWFGHTQSESLFVSVLTLGELRKGVNKLSDSPRKARLENWLSNEVLPMWFEDRIVSIDLGVAECWGKLIGDINRTIPAIDSLLAATAIHFNMQIVSRNEKDFHDLEVMVFNLWNYREN